MLSILNLFLQMKVNLKLNLVVFIPVVIIGVLGGLLGSLFIFMFLKMAKYRRRMVQKIKRPEAANAFKVIEVVVLCVRTFKLQNMHIKILHKKTWMHFVTS